MWTCGSPRAAADAREGSPSRPVRGEGQDPGDARRGPRRRIDTARVLVADVSAEGRVAAVEEKRERLGLGAEIARTGTLSRDTVRTVARACRGYAKVGRALGAERAQVIVTAPGRQGRAPGLLVSALAEATRLPVLVLSADEEGRLAYDGAVARARALPGGVVGVVDVAAARLRSSSATRVGVRPGWARSTSARSG